VGLVSKNGGFVVDILGKSLVEEVVGVEVGDHREVGADFLLVKGLELPGREFEDIPSLGRVGLEEFEGGGRGSVAG